MLRCALRFCAVVRCALLPVLCCAVLRRAAPCSQWHAAVCCDMQLLKTCTPLLHLMQADVERDFAADKFGLKTFPTLVLLPKSGKSGEHWGTGMASFDCTAVMFSRTRMRREGGVARTP